MQDALGMEAQSKSKDPGPALSFFCVLGFCLFVLNSPDHSRTLKRPALNGWPRISSRDTMLAPLSYV